MTKSQANKLGERLRAQGQPDADALARLQEFRAEYDRPMLAVQAALSQTLGLKATSRLKTVNTIVEKLRREKTRLAEMQDIAGLRLVEEMGLAQQDALVEKIVGLYPGARVVDRRAKPNHGYRAMHVVALVDAKLVEIQVRTNLQDLWAQAMEKLADELGREIRYGGAPKSGREEVVALHQISSDVDAVERMLEELRLMEDGLPLPRQAATKQREILLLRLRLRRQRSRLEENSRNIRARLETMLGLGGSTK